ncbi:MAG: sugar kinase [Anaerolineae bacterium]|nr:sugar kinase [Anaerolineae bacterium]
MNACGVRVVCLGETMLMFAPQPHETLEYCDQFTVFHGGAESNVAIGLERLGVHAGWVGKLPENALGRKVVNEVRSFGVDASAVVWSDRGRLGTFFFEWGAYPRPLMTIYDRAHSAATTLVSDDLDWAYLGGAEWLHLTGITPATSEICRESSCAIARRARQLGVKISFDVNYRSLLWSQAEARACCERILPYVNVLVGTEADLTMLTDGLAERESVVQGLHARHGCEAVVMTLGAEGSLGYDGQALAASAGYQVQVVNRLGAGDAFVAGLLYGYLQGELQAGLEYGSAMAALKMTVPQNIPLINKEDVERLLAGRRSDVIR